MNWITSLPIPLQMGATQTPLREVVSFAVNTGVHPQKLIETLGEGRSSTQSANLLARSRKTELNSNFFSYKVLFDKVLRRFMQASYCRSKFLCFKQGNAARFTLQVYP
jgi:hypothetical protein